MLQLTLVLSSRLSLGCTETVVVRRLPRKRAFMVLRLLCSSVVSSVWGIVGVGMLWAVPSWLNAVQILGADSEANDAVMIYMNALAASIGASILFWDVFRVALLRRLNGMLELSLVFSLDNLLRVRFSF